MWYVNFVFDILEALTWVTLAGPDQLVNQVAEKIIVVTIATLIYVIAVILQIVNGLEKMGVRYTQDSWNRRRGEPEKFKLRKIDNKKMLLQYKVILVLLSLFLPFSYIIICLQFDVLGAMLPAVIIFGPWSCGAWNKAGCHIHGMFGLIRSINHYMAQMAARQNRYDKYNAEYQVVKNSFKNINI